MGQHYDHFGPKSQQRRACMSIRIRIPLWIHSHDLQLQASTSRNVHNLDVPIVRLKVLFSSSKEHSTKQDFSDQIVPGGSGPVGCRLHNDWSQSLLGFTNLQLRSISITISHLKSQSAVRNPHTSENPCPPRLSGMCTTRTLRRIHTNYPAKYSTQIRRAGLHCPWVWSKLLWSTSRRPRVPRVCGAWRAWTACCFRTALPPGGWLVWAVTWRPALRRTSAASDTTTWWTRSRSCAETNRNLKYRENCVCKQQTTFQTASSVSCQLCVRTLRAERLWCTPSRFLQERPNCLLLPVPSVSPRVKKESVLQTLQPAAQATNPCPSCLIQLSHDPHHTPSCEDLAWRGSESWYKLYFSALDSKSRVLAFKMAAKPSRAK